MKMSRSLSWVPAVVLTLLLGSTSFAQYGEENQDALVFKEIIVTASPEEPQTEQVSKEVLDFGTYVNIGEVLDALPGVSVVRRSASSTEPVIRGLGWERVQTQVGYVPIYGGCPGRMDPPVTYLQPDNFQEVTVVKGVPSVTLGSGGTGGRVIVSTDYKRSPDAPPELGGWVTSTYNGARNGFLTGAGFKGGNKWVDYYGTFNSINYGDYETGAGKEVPSSQEEYGGAVSVGVRPMENHRWWNGLIFVRDEGIEFPSMPMDSERTNTWIYNTGYRMDFPGCTLEQVEVNGGFAILDHRMSNRDKPNRGMLEAVANTDSDSFAGRAKQNWRLTPWMVLTTGVDYYNLARDGVRDRLIVASNASFTDHIWPDASQWDVGGFSELNIDLTEDWRLRLGGRIDSAQSDADAVDESIMVGMMQSTIRDQFVAFNGPDAADVERSEILGSGNLLLQWMVMEELGLHLGGGVTSRPASVTERFYAFAPAPSGFQIGNPDLDPEVKYEVDWGLDWIKPWGLVSLSMFYYWVDDYILETQVGTLNNLPVRGFRNVDARLWGAELGALVRPIDHWSFPLSLSYVRGRNTSDDRDLPEIPPFECRAAVRAEYGEAIPWWIEFGGRFAARQDKVDEDFPEDETGSFSFFHLYGGMKPFKGLKIQVGIDNLLDANYNEHLTREAVFDAGDLNAGDEVPAPGRSFFATVRYEF